LIFARISVDGERRELSIKEQIEAAAWNAKEETVKGKSIEVRATNDYTLLTIFFTWESLPVRRKSYL
jgi:hypothetical protein